MHVEYFLLRRRPALGEQGMLMRTGRDILRVSALPQHLAAEVTGKLDTEPLRAGRRYEAAATAEPLPLPLPNADLKWGSPC